MSTSFANVLSHILKLNSDLQLHMFSFDCRFSEYSALFDDHKVKSLPGSPSCLNKPFSLYFYNRVRLVFHYICRGIVFVQG